ncbi:hypothetical protein [Sphingomonas sp.]|uniref:hypothetical protein n=1 Tax=Sphingomonas sp. TaxID=28214 RepID=UPI0025F618E1|nr:hypothetical protein [Sphingomonas sp.]
MTDPHTSEKPTHVEGPEVRAGETSGHMRYVLGISVVLAVVILSLIVWGPVLFSK